LKARFSDYSKAYDHVSMRRADGILELRLHSDGGPLVWGHGPHSELGHCFADVAADEDNRVVILTGTGDSFCSKLDESWVGHFGPKMWDEIFRDGRRLLLQLLEIEVPVLGVVNGKASVHAEIPLVSDVVLASQGAVFQDAPHFRFGTVPGDGAHVIWPYLIGPTRARYFLMTGQRIDADEALRLGFVNEVLTPERLEDRAWELAQELTRQPELTLRYTRSVFTLQLKRLLGDDLALGLALEGLAAHASWPTGEP
jgi:enoyl-CoA hydratase/carnithine racemase